MNLKEIEYILKIEEERNVTRAAQKLFMTPSALNQQLLRLEQEIGTPLFLRSRKGFELTEAGEVYIAAAKEILRTKQETYHRLQDIAESKKGNLSIGLPPDRGAALFSHIYPGFHKEYPDIVMHVHEVSVQVQQQMIAQGDLDIGFMTLLPHQKTHDEYITLSSEEIFLVVPDDCPARKHAVPSESDSWPELDLSFLKTEPFALVYKNSTLRELVDQLFQQAGFSPNILLETARLSTILSMASDHICCGLVPEFFCDPAIPGIAFYALPQHPVWEQVVSYRKKGYLSKPARRFIELAAEYWKRADVG